MSLPNREARGEGSRLYMHEADSSHQPILRHPWCSEMTPRSTLASLEQATLIVEQIVQHRNRQERREPSNRTAPSNEIGLETCYLSLTSFRVEVKSTAINRYRYTPAGTTEPPSSLPSQRAECVPAFTSCWTRVRTSLPLRSYTLTLTSDFIGIAYLISVSS